MRSTTPTTQRQVVAVGVDGSSPATAAARYAADFAARNAWDLWLISAYSVPSVSASADAAIVHRSRRAAVGALRETLDQVRLGPRVHLRTLVQPGPVNAVPTAVCAEVQLLVLGQHHLALLERRRVGNHTAAIISKASCPVTVVPAGWDPRHTPAQPIVVALDGVTDAHAALELAFDDAAARRASVVVMHVRTLLSDEVEDPEVSADLAEIVAGAKQDFPDVPVQITLLDGPVGQAILDQSEMASVVVLGRPDHHHIGSWRWSVARSVLNDVACPVTVVADTQRTSRLRQTASP